MWLAGREIPGAVQDEQLGSNFGSRSCVGKLRELPATRQAQVYNRVWGVCVFSHEDSLGPPDGLGRGPQEGGGHWSWSQGFRSPGAQSMDWRGGTPGGHAAWPSLPAPGEGATAGGGRRASKPALLWLYREQDSPGIRRFWVSTSEVETRFRVLTASQGRPRMLVQRPRLERQSPRAGWAEFSCKGPGSVFPGFGGLTVFAQENIYFCFIDYTKAFLWITTNWKS